MRQPAIISTMEVEQSRGEWSDEMRELCSVEPKSLATGGGSSRLFAKFAQAGLTRQVGPTRILTPLRNLELPRQGGAEAWHLFALFDCALEGGFPAVILDYVVQVCQDSQVVSSDPTESFLMRGNLVESWCEEVALALRREFHTLVETVDPRSQEFLSKGLWLETVLRNLEVVFEVLAAGGADRAASAALLDSLSQVTLALEACRTCNWYLCSEDLGGLQPKPSSSGVGREHAPFFVGDLLADLGLPKDAYPFVSFVDAVKKIFLAGRDRGAASATKGLRAERRAFLYYLFDIGCGEASVQNFAVQFNLASSECAAVRAYCLLDRRDGSSVDEACLILPSVANHINHTKVVQELMALGRSQNALDIIRSRLDNGSFPTLAEAMLSLECKGLYEGFLHCRDLFEAAGDDAASSRIAEQCTRAWCERHQGGKVNQLPFGEREEACLPKSGRALYLAMRRRYKEAEAALKDAPEEDSSVLRKLLETAAAVLPAETS